MARRPPRRIERQRGAENLDSFAQPRVTTKAFREPTLGLHLVDEVVEHFVLFLQGLQHGPDFVELGPRDGGVQRFDCGLLRSATSLCRLWLKRKVSGRSNGLGNPVEYIGAQCSQSLKPIAEYFWRDPRSGGDLRNLLAAVMDGLAELAGQ